MDRFSNLPARTENVCTHLAGGGEIIMLLILSREVASVNNYEQYYSEKSFLDKVTDCASKAGKEVLIKAFQLFYVLDKPDVPLWAKSAIIGAIGYFILPVDAIPDFLPVAGYTDDLGVMAAALGTVAMYVDDEVTSKAEKKVDQLLG